jgi:hypothetical protein
MTPLLLVFICKFSVGDCLLDSRVALIGGVSGALTPGGAVKSRCLISAIKLALDLISNEETGAARGDRSSRRRLGR